MLWNKINNSIWIRRTLLLVIDVLSVLAASFFALWIRCEFAIKDIPDKYSDLIADMVPLTIILTVVVFFFFRLYSSLWMFAGATEAAYIVGACVVSGFLNTFMILTLNKDTLVPLDSLLYTELVLMGLSM